MARSIERDSREITLFIEDSGKPVGDSMRWQEPHWGNNQ
jgi:hypothetical protein